MLWQVVVVTTSQEYIVGLEYREREVAEVSAVELVKLVADNK